MSFTISNDLFSAQTECILTNFQLKSSRLAQDFCSEAVAWAPLCGMMLGRIAAPLVRFRSAQLFSSFGFNQTLARCSSWGIAVGTEGTIMAAAPGVLMGQGISSDLWRGSIHGTLTMMMAQGVMRGIPMNGVIREVSQDLSFMAVNVFCGEVGITDQVHGSLIEQYCEARIVSVRMKISGELVHATCIQATYAQAKYEVQRKVQESIQRDSRNPRRWEGVLQEVAQLTGRSRLVDPYGRIVETNWETPDQRIIRKSQKLFMAWWNEPRGKRALPPRPSLESSPLDREGEIKRLRAARGEPEFGYDNTSEEWERLQRLQEAERQRPDEELLEAEASPSPFNRKVRELEAHHMRPVQFPADQETGWHVLIREMGKDGFIEPESKSVAIPPDDSPVQLSNFDYIGHRVRIGVSRELSGGLIRMMIVEGILVGRVDEGELVGTYTKIPFYVLQEQLTGHLVRIRAFERNKGSDVFFYHPERPKILSK